MGAWNPVLLWPIVVVANFWGQFLQDFYLDTQVRENRTEYQKVRDSAFPPLFGRMFLGRFAAQVRPCTRRGLLGADESGDELCAYGDRVLNGL